MNTITVKVISWDNDSQSLTCKFASDETASSNPDDYEAYAFQPNLMWPTVTTAEGVMEELARAGISICEEIKSREDLANNPTQLAVYSGLAGQEQTFNVSDITVTPSTTNPEVDPDTVEV